MTNTNGWEEGAPNLYHAYTYYVDGTPWAFVRRTNELAPKPYVGRIYFSGEVRYFDTVKEAKIVMEALVHLGRDI